MNDVTDETVKAAAKWLAVEITGFELDDLLISQRNEIFAKARSLTAALARKPVGEEENALNEARHD